MPFNHKTRKMNERIRPNNRRSDEGSSNDCVSSANNNSPQIRELSSRHLQHDYILRPGPPAGGGAATIRGEASSGDSRRAAAPLLQLSLDQINDSFLLRARAELQLQHDQRSRTIDRSGGQDASSFSSISAGPILAALQQQQQQHARVAASLQHRSVTSSTPDVSVSSLLSSLIRQQEQGQQQQQQQHPAQQTPPLASPATGGTAAELWLQRLASAPAAASLPPPIATLNQQNAILASALAGLGRARAAAAGIADIPWSIVHNAGLTATTTGGEIPSPAPGGAALNPSSLLSAGVGQGGTLLGDDLLAALLLRQRQAQHASSAGDPRMSLLSSALSSPTYTTADATAAARILQVRGYRTAPSSSTLLGNFLSTNSAAPAAEGGALYQHPSAAVDVATTAARPTGSSFSSSFLPIPQTDEAALPSEIHSSMNDEREIARDPAKSTNQEDSRKHKKKRKDRSSAPGADDEQVLPAKKTNKKYKQAGGQAASSPSRHRKKRSKEEDPDSEDALDEKPPRKKVVQAENQRPYGPKPFKLTNRPPITLAIPSDEGILSPYQCFLRKQIEVFETSTLQIGGKAQGRNVPIVAGQVGIECIYCARKPRDERTSGSIFYSQTLGGLYQIAQNMSKTHFLNRCENIPEDVQAHLAKLQKSLNRGLGGKRYWHDAAKSLGLIEDDSILKFASSSAISSTLGQQEEDNTRKTTKPSSPPPPSSAQKSSRDQKQNETKPAREDELGDTRGEAPTRSSSLWSNSSSSSSSSSSTAGGNDESDQDEGGESSAST